MYVNFFCGVELYLILYFFYKKNENLIFIKILNWSVSNKVKDKKKNKKVLVNGLLKHTVSNPKEQINQISLCTIIHNRDKNTVHYPLGFIILKYYEFKQI